MPDNARKFRGGRGEGVRVFVCEPGNPDEDHPDLRHNLTELVAVGEEGNSLGLHANLVLGVIGADENDDKVTGVAPEAECYYVGVVNDPAVLGEALDGHARAGDVVNLSVTTILGAPYEWYKPWGDLIETWTGNGVTFTLAAGNQRIDYDATWPNDAHVDRGAIVVANATYDRAWKPAGSSNYGSRIDCCAPGVNIWSTLSKTIPHGVASGTSFAAPYVAGLLALIQAISRKYFGTYRTPRELREWLRTTGEELDYGNLKNRKGRFGRLATFDALGKRLFEMPDYDNDDRVGFLDFLRLSAEYGTRFKFKDLRRLSAHYGRRWPDSYCSP